MSNKIMVTKKESDKKKIVNSIRVPTGVPGFDKLCQGGFYKNSINAVLGGPGSGKTTFLLQFLWNGANMFDENGLYVSFESHDQDVFTDAATYGWDFLKLNSNGKCRFIRFSPRDNVEQIRKEIEKLVLNNNIKRVCIDPVSILSIKLENELVIREILYDLTASLKRLNITTIIADETSEGTVENFSLGGDEIRSRAVKFLCDSLVNFYSSGIGGESDRAVRITKMRRTNHIRGPVPFKITDNGIIVSSKN